MYLDLDDWPRRSHFDFYRRFEQPFFGLVVQVDVTETRAWCRDLDVSFFLAGWYAALGALGVVPQLRQRLRGDRVWQHDTVAIGSTVLAPDETFRFAYLEPAATFPAFAAAARARIDAVTAGPPVLDTDPRDDLVHGTVIPWVDFTAIRHARRIDPDDSVPKLAYGRTVERGGRVVMSVALDAHHALVDGLHAARFLDGLQARLADPVSTFGEPR